MTHTIIIEVKNKWNEVEALEEITAASIIGAKNKATRWINKNYYPTDYSEISKREITSLMQVWEIK